MALTAEQLRQTRKQSQAANRGPARKKVMHKGVPGLHQRGQIAGAFYGEAAIPERCEMRKGDKVNVIGAAGPMGVTHVIRDLCVGEDVTFADLKGTLYAFARHLMGSDIKLRFRASFFPFTEPSAEMDFEWEGQWFEWGGCGMIHPEVLRNCRIDPERYQGFAFGMGIDRTAMERFGIPSIQLLFDGDVRVVGQI